MKKKLIMLMGALMTLMSMNAQEVFNLYPGKTPGMAVNNNKESVIKAFGGELTEVVNVSNPTLTVYHPSKEKNTGAAMLVLPGGGFTALSVINEGQAQAEYFVSQGITAIILKYRTQHVDGNTPEELLKSTNNVKRERSTVLNACDDARAAVSYVRKHAVAWGIDPNRIGMIGFSAGAITTGQVALNHTAESKPNMVALVYGAPYFELFNASFFGKTDTTINVPEDAAPLFECAPEFDMTDPDYMFDTFKAWRAKKIPAELHFFPYVQHGFANREGKTGVKAWHELLLHFMKDCGMIK